jgi:hypothetical protein
MATRFRGGGSRLASERVSESGACRLDLPGEVSVATDFAVRANECDVAMDCARLLLGLNRRSAATSESEAKKRGEAMMELERVKVGRAQPGRCE